MQISLLLCLPLFDCACPPQMRTNFLLSHELSHCKFELVSQLSLTLRKVVVKIKYGLDYARMPPSAAQRKGRIGKHNNTCLGR